MSPALAGGFLTTAPPGKPLAYFFDLNALTCEIEELYYNYLPRFQEDGMCLHTYVKYQAQGTSLAVQ